MAAMPSTAACAAAMVVMVGMRASTAARRMAFSSKKVSWPRGRVDDELDAVALDEVDDVGPAFLHLENPLDDEP
jgi:chitodextrinase